MKEFALNKVSGRIQPQECTIRFQEQISESASTIAQGGQGACQAGQGTLLWVCHADFAGRLQLTCL